MTKTRVLIVDDSPLVRSQLVGWINADSALEVAGTAANGRQALDKFGSLRPDVVVLDIEMPLMDGLETLRELRKRDASVPVIMFSTLTSRGASMTLDALAMGATDYMLKPSSLSEGGQSPAEVRAGLLDKIKGLRAARSPTAPTASGVRLADTGAPRRVDVVAIGTSTGGPNALEALFAQLPADFPVPILVVQHMPPFFTGILAERLSRVSPLRVAEGVAGRVPMPGEAWVAPGGLHMTVTRAGPQPTLATNEDPPENACRPAVDVLFRSVAEVYGDHALAVVLTGMGQDGLRGAQRIRERGGRVLAQDQASSVVWSMPGHVARAGLASALLPPKEMAAEIVRLVSRGGATGHGFPETPNTR